MRTLAIFPLLIMAFGMASTLKAGYRDRFEQKPSKARHNLQTKSPS